MPLVAALDGGKRVVAVIGQSAILRIRPGTRLARYFTISQWGNNFCACSASASSSGRRSSRRLQPNHYSDILASGLDAVVDTNIDCTVLCGSRGVPGVAQTGGPVLKIPPIKTSIKLDQQQVEITLWGTLSPKPTGTFALALTVDLGDFQEHLTPVLSAQLKRDDRCGDRLSVERAAIVPRRRRAC